MSLERKLDRGTIRSVCEALARAMHPAGLSDAEINRYLSVCGIHEPENTRLPRGNKRDRLYAALVEGDGLDCPSTRARAFIEAALDPASHMRDRERFERLRNTLNGVLVFKGLTVGKDGKLAETEAATTHAEADELVGRMRKELERRKVHRLALAACTQEILREGNPFHAQLEAAKSVTDRIRQLSGSVKDGHDLIDEVFVVGKKKDPVLSFNPLLSEDDRSEHTGFIHLAKAMYSLYRNPTAHQLRADAEDPETEALEALTVISRLHKMLDRARPHPGGRVLVPAEPDDDET